MHLCAQMLHAETDELELPLSGGRLLHVCQCLSCSEHDCSTSTLATEPALQFRKSLFLEVDLGLMVQACNQNSQETAAGESQVQGHPTVE